MRHGVAVTGALALQFAGVYLPALQRLLDTEPRIVDFVPKGMAHTFANLSGQPARALLICCPAGFERHFEQVLAHQAGGPVPEPSAVMRETYVVGPRIDGALDVPLL